MPKPNVMAKTQQAFNTPTWPFEEPKSYERRTYSRKSAQALTSSQGVKSLSLSQFSFSFGFSHPRFLFRLIFKMFSLISFRSILRYTVVAFRDQFDSIIFSLSHMSNTIHSHHHQ